jgi:hypothetical protein
MAQLDKKLANDKALMQEEARLQNQYKSSGSTGGSSKSSGSSGTTFSKSTASSASTNKTTTTTPKTTQQSILALGYGPISASRLNELVASGVVEEYTQNGMTMFRKSTNPKKTNKKTTLIGGGKF